MILRQPAPIETRPLALVDIADPEPGGGELLVRVRACGVCRSNFHTIEGDWLPEVPAKLPIVPGHEIVGTVARRGEGAEEFDIGERVGIQPLWSSCLRCEYCLTARENLCPYKQIAGETVDGGYAEYVLATAQHTYHVPDALSDAEAAPLFCPGVTAYRAVAKAQLRPGQRVALFGMGGVGHMVIQFAKIAGADVVVVARGRRHRELAEELGAVQTVDPSTTEPADALTSAGVDAAIVFAPSGEMLTQAIAGTKRGGIVVNGAAGDAVASAFAEEKQLVGSVIGNRHDMRTVLDIAAAGKVKVIAKTFPLEKATEALLALKNGDVEARAVLVMS